MYASSLCPCILPFLRKILMPVSHVCNGCGTHIRAIYIKFRGEKVIQKRKFVYIFRKYTIYMYRCTSSSDSDRDSSTKYTNVYVYINWINAFRFPWFIITYYINFYLDTHTHTPMKHTVPCIYFNLIEMQENKRKSAKENRRESVYVCMWERHDWHRGIKNLKKNVYIYICLLACMCVYLKSTQQLFSS